MTLEQLRVLNCIVETGSLSEAAEKIHKTQPALSMAIKKLESEFGFEILDRSAYRLTLTEQGKAFYNRTLEILLNAEQLSSLGKHLGEGNEPKVRLAYDQSCPRQIVTDALLKVQKLYPETEFRIYGESRFGAMEMLAKAEVDLAISPWWPTFYALGDLDSFKISNFQIILVAAPSLFPSERKQNASALKQEVHLGIEESDISIDSEKLTLLTGCREWKTRDMGTLKQLLLAGLGWGFIPEMIVEEELVNGSLIRLEPDDLEFSVSGELRLIKRQQDSLGPVAMALWHAFH